MTNSKRIPKEHLLLVWATLIFLTPFFKKFNLGNFSSLFDKFEEIAFILLFPSIIQGFHILIKRPWGIVSILSFGLYLIFGILSWTLSAQLSAKALFFQFLLELKLPLTILAIIGTGKLIYIWNKLQPFLKALLFISIPLILWQFLLPNSYDSVFPAGKHQGLFFTSFYALPRASGVFWHPGQLGLISGILFGVYFISWRFEKKSSDMIWCLISFLILLTTLSRNEIAAAFLGLIIIYFFLLKTEIIGGKLIAFILACFIFYFLIWPVFSTYLTFVFYKFGLNNPYQTISARALFYIDSVSLANINPPFGVGFGGFGGHGANIFDSPYYKYLNYNSLWWFKKRLFLTDTFWPHVLGETGWAGLFCYFFYLFSTFKILLQEYKHSSNARPFNGNNKKTILIAIYSFLFIFLNSFSSPNFTSMLSLLSGLLFMGAINPNNQTITGSTKHLQL